MERLIQSARQIAQDIAPYQSTLIGNGRPADFLDQLTATTNALEAAKEAMNNAISVRKKASVGIDTTLLQGRVLVRSLDAMMHSCFGKTPEIMAQWHQAKRIQQSSSSKTRSSASKTQTTATNAGTPTATTTATTSAAPKTVTTQIMPTATSTSDAPAHTSA